MPLTEENEQAKPHVDAEESSCKTKEKKGFLTRGQRKIQEWKFARIMRQPFLGSINQSSAVLEASMLLDDKSHKRAASRYEFDGDVDEYVIDFLVSDAICDKAKWKLLGKIRPDYSYSGSREKTVGVAPEIVETLYQHDLLEWIVVFYDAKLIRFLSTSYVPDEAKLELMSLIRKNVSASSLTLLEDRTEIDELLTLWQRESGLSFKNLPALYLGTNQWSQVIGPFLQNAEIPENLRACFLKDCKFERDAFRVLTRDFVRTQNSEAFWNQLARAEISDFRLKGIIEVIGDASLTTENFWERAPELELSSDMRYKIYCEVPSFDLDCLITEDFWNQLVALDLPDVLALGVVEIIPDGSLNTVASQWGQNGIIRGIITDSSLSIVLRRAFVRKLELHRIDLKCVEDFMMDSSFDPEMRQLFAEGLGERYGDAENLPWNRKQRRELDDQQRFSVLKGRILKGQMTESAYEALEGIWLHSDNCWEKQIFPLLADSKISEEDKIKILDKVKYFDQLLCKNLQILNDPIHQGSPKLQSYLISQLSTFFFPKGATKKYILRALRHDNSIFPIAQKVELVGLYHHLTFNHWGHVLLSNDYPREVRLAFAKKVRSFDEEQTYIRPTDADLDPEIIRVAFEGLCASIYTGSPYLVGLSELFQSELFGIEPSDKDRVDPDKLDEIRPDARFCGSFLHFFFDRVNDKDSDVNSHNIRYAKESLPISDLEFIEIANCYHRGEVVESLIGIDGGVLENWERIKEFARNDHEGELVWDIRALLENEEKIDPEIEGMDGLVKILLEAASLPKGYLSALWKMIPFSIDWNQLESSQSEKICAFLQSDANIENKKSVFCRFENLPIVLFSFFESDETRNIISHRLAPLRYDEIQGYIMDSNVSVQLKRNLIRKIDSIDFDRAQLPKLPSRETVQVFLDNIILPPEEANEELREEELYLLLIAALGRDGDSADQLELIGRLDFDRASYKGDLIAKISELESVCFQQKDHAILKQVLNHPEATTLNEAITQLTSSAVDNVRDSEKEQGRKELENQVPLTVYFRLGHTINYGMAGEAMLRLFQRWVSESDVFSNLDLVPRKDDYPPLKSTRDLPDVRWRPISGDDFVNAVQKNDTGAVVYLSHSTPPEDCTVALVSSGTKNEEKCSDEHLDLGLELEDHYLPGDDDNILETMTFDELAVHLYPRFLALEKATFEKFNSQP